MTSTPDMTSTSPRSAWLHRFAVATCCAALLPITIGAIVTTMNWGMAIHGWPGSDGHGMFSYPWFDAAIHKFTEHGHRLAGILIGLFSIGLAAWTWRVERRRWVAWAATAVLAGVIIQGLLGGQRVLANDPRVALVHGQFAAWVLALMGVVALVTGRNWHRVSADHNSSVSPRLRLLAFTLPVLLVVQSSLGGWIRHLGGGLLEHLAFSVPVVLVVLATSITALRTHVSWLQRIAWILLGLVGIQLALGATAWITRFGWPTTGYVAVQGAPWQVVSRTAHAVTGLLIFLTSINLTVRVARLDWLSRRELLATESPLAHAVRATGGLV